MPIGKYRGVTLQRELVNKIEEYIKAWLKRKLEKKKAETAMGV